MKRFWWIPAILLIPMISLATYLMTRSFNGQIEAIQFKSDITLNGILAKPDTPGPHPAILLLHGAGSNHQTYDKLYFKFHANAFLKKGFAVMIYSKRSSDDVNYRYFTYQDLLKDAESAINFLKEREDILQNNIGLMGISESGWFTPELAVKHPEIKFLINRVSSSLSVRETLKHEVKSDAIAEGFNMVEVNEVILPITERIWDYYLGINEQEMPVEGVERLAINEILGELHQHDRFKQWFQARELSQYDSTLYHSRAMRYGYDPSTFVEKVNIPMLYVLAGKDKNIPTAEVIKHLSQLQQQGKKIDLKVYPEASHYLYKFGLDDGPYEGWLYHDDYPDLMANWALQHVD